MRKLIAAMNMTLDGFCDHTSMIADDEIHQHYTDLLRSADTLIYGRITYQLMESYWPTIVKNPTGNRPVDEFAVAIDNISKVVFSRTLKNVAWKNAKVATRSITDEILELKRGPGKDILVGSPGLIAAAANLNLIDEYQLCIHPVVAGGGLPLFESIQHRTVFKLLKTKTFSSGAIVLYYAPAAQGR